MQLGLCDTTGEPKIRLHLAEGALLPAAVRHLFPRGPLLFHSVAGGGDGRVMAGTACSWLSVCRVKGV